MALNPYLQQPERQYVGARYVPKLAEPFDWDETAVYEPLTIVGYMGSSYTSRKLVPAGTVPVEGEFWALTGNLNGAVTNLQTQINRIDSQITNINSTIQTTTDNLQTQISSNDNDIASLSSRVGANTTSISDLKEDLKNINDLVKRSIMIITDSYGLYPKNGTPYTNQVISRLANTGNIKDVYALNLSGLSFVPHSTGGATFQSGFANWVTSNPDKAAALTDIYIIGGANECFFDNISTVVPPAMKSFSDYARSVSPNATLHLAAATKKYDLGYEIKNFQVYDAYANNAALYGYAFSPDVSVTMCWTPYLGDDRVHPNQTGANVLANATVAWILNQHVWNNVRADFTSPTNFTNISVKIKTQMFGNIKHVGGVLIASDVTNLPDTITFDGTNCPFNPRAGFGLQGPLIIWDGSSYIPVLATWRAGSNYNISIEIGRKSGTQIAPAPVSNRDPYYFQPLPAYSS